MEKNKIYLFSFLGAGSCGPESSKDFSPKKDLTSDLKRLGFFILPGLYTNCEPSIIVRLKQKSGQTGFLQPDFFPATT